MNKKLLFIFNPHTSGGRLSSHLLDIICTLAAGGYEVTAHPTTSQGDARQTAAQAAGTYDLVVCCGGDGTLNETVHGLLNIASPPPLAYIPGGTTNDFASSLGLPRSNMVKAAQLAVTSEMLLHCDIGLVNNQRIFTYVAAFGAFTDVSYSTPQKFKNLVGYMAYILEGIQRLPTLQSMQIHVCTDTEEFEEDILFGMVSNSTSVGGFSFAQQVAMDDGAFEMLMVRRPQNLSELAGLSAALVTRNINSPYIIAKHVQSVSIVGQAPIAWTLDGEYGGEHIQTDIAVKPQALAIHI